MKYHIVVTGCQMNKADAERLSAYLESLDYVYEADITKADVAVLVTCGVRQSAENRIYTLARKIKQDNSKVKLVLTGCLSARIDVQKRLKDSVDIWLDIVDLPLLAEKLSITDPLRPFHINPLLTSPLVRGRRTRNSRGRSESPSPYQGEGRGGVLSTRDYLSLTANHQSTFSAYVPVGNGCNNFCAYCVVPYARGRETYRPHEEIVAEVKDLITPSTALGTGRGYKEIILIAQNVNSYASPVIKDPTLSLPLSRGGEENKADGGEVFPPPYEGGGQEGVDFADLISMIDELEGDFWIRFATSHPKDLSDKLIEVVAKSQKVCPHWHIALQSGSDEILKLMNRQYTAEHFLNLVKKIRALNSTCSITTDIIVGFPGETRAKFLATKKLMAEIGFAQAYISRYSPRPGTVASKMTDDVTPAEKQSREKELEEVLRAGAKKFNEQFVGQTIPVLIEQVDGHNYYGKNARFTTVRFVSDTDYKVGDLASVKITEANYFSCKGRA